jgi:uncharacterized membrane protein
LLWISRNFRARPRFRGNGRFIGLAASGQHGRTGQKRGTSATRVRERRCFAPHVEESVQAIGKLHLDHYQQATAPQRAVNDLTDFLGRPLAVTIAAWVGFNVAAARMGRAAIDPPPFTWLGLALAAGALFMAVLILAAQRHAGELAARREQLTLQLALVSEQKSAKIIQLLEEMRRDSPQIANRVDEVAAAMSEPADPGAVLEAFKDAADSAPPNRRGLTPL